MAQRVELAQALWESIECGLQDVAPEEAISEAIRRDAELTSGVVLGWTHEGVIAAARQSIM